MKECLILNFSPPINSLEFCELLSNELPLNWGSGDHPEAQDYCDVWTMLITLRQGEGSVLQLLREVEKFYIPRGNEFGKPVTCPELEALSAMGLKNGTVLMRNPHVLNKLIARLVDGKAEKTLLAVTEWEDVMNGGLIL